MPWVSADNMALLVDQYELTMLRAYYAESMAEQAVFSLFVRRLPEDRNYLLACGLETVLAYLERVRFDDDARAYLESMGPFDEAFLDWLMDLRFRGDVWAVPEGTPVFADEPILEVRGSLPEAQLVETFVMNQIHLQTVLASKASRVRHAAGERKVVDFGLRRMHGADAGLRSARAFHVAGLDATSNVLAGRTYGIPVTGTMAHSYVQAHDDEMAAFRAFTRTFPDTILLVDTYQTLDGVRNVVRLAEELGDRFRVRGVRLDSGDLAELAKATRGILDAAGLGNVEIFASGGLDEHAIGELVRGGAPIDGFGVGTGMGVSRDAPSLDMAYKLTEYDGRGRLKLSSGKPVLPGRKQVFRIEEEGGAVRDVIARADEALPGRPLMEKVMEGGARLEAGRTSLEDARSRAREELARLPERVRKLEAATPPYAVDVSESLGQLQKDIERKVTDRETTS
ncbi:MAG: nicotinate phosphoribosyltransferase [Gemmatimonadota bacterium]|nr:nicotinate phosphoribosyltransferase [Gemmatimonadota bacterium]